ncbi:MAG: glycosyltransferase family 39 protein, partial [bacterium]|nr:glycosyltransferase family 39 protein [bacterium]
MSIISPKAIFKEKSRIILVAILLFSFAIGITGIFYSRSLPYAVQDEAPNMITTLKMMADGSFRPAYPSSYYFPLTAYIYLPFFAVLFIFLRLSGFVTSLAALKVIGIIDYAEFLPLVRFISVLFGVASVFLIYKITEKLFNNKFTGLISSFLLSTSLLFVQLSHFGRVWILQIFFILFALYLIIAKLYLKDKPLWKDYFWTAISIGVSFGINMVGLFIYLPFLVVHFLKNRGVGFIGTFIKNKYFWLTNFIICLFIPLLYVLNPYGFGNNKGWFGKAVAAFFQGNTYKINFLERIFYDKILFEYEPVLFFLFIPCAILLFLKERKIFYILTSFI